MPVLIGEVETGGYRPRSAEVDGILRAGKIEAGTVWGNCHAMIDTALPFGGYKESGIGREQGRQGLEASLETKTVIIQM